MKRKGKDINRNISLPELTSIDNIKQFPRYSSILTRQDGEGVGIEEIDTLQMELETLLVNALQRARKFQVELMILENKTEKNDLIQKKPKLSTNTSIVTSIPPSSTSINDLNDKQTQSTPNAKRFKASSHPQRPSSTFTCNTDENSLVIRNDISDIFWNMVQPYCSEITDDDIKFLKEQIELNNKVQSFTKELPSLGKHYSIKWAEEDTGSEIKENNRLNIDINGSLTTHNDNNNKKRKNFNNFLNEIELFQTSNETETSQYGPLTQRLISALIEQNLMTPFGGTTNLSDFDMSNNNDVKTNNKQNQHQQQFNENATTSNLFENKIREELIEQGILDKNDLDLLDENSNNKQNKNQNGSIDNNEQQNDEIANEIKKLQNELLVIADKCKDTQYELLNNAKQVMLQQNLRKKIDQCDCKIQEYFNKSVALKQSNKYFPRKEKDKLNELIKEREGLKLQMSQIMLPNFGSL